MKHLKILTETSMYKALTDQHEAVNLSNEENVISNDIHDADTLSKEPNVSTNDISDSDSDV